MLVSKMYQLVSVKYRLNQYLTDITDTNRYLTNI